MRRRAIGKLGHLFAAGLAVAVAAGCQPNQPTSARPTTNEALAQIPEGVVPVRPRLTGPTSPATAVSPSDPAASNPRLLGLDVYILNVPAGGVSRNDAFWKRLDETAAVAPDEYALLFRNGVRVGIGDQADWPFFKGILDERPAATQLLSYVAPSAKSAELDLRKEVAAETVFYFDHAGRLSGRSYDNCSNLWSLSFQSVPRDPDLIRVSLTPMIRSQRKRLEWVKHRLREDDPPTREIAYVAPEYLFDLAVDASVAPGKFLVVAPSADATGGSVGDTFLASEGMGQRVEKVLILVPRLVTATVEAVKAK